MKIIGCYIVRNEADALQRSLTSIKNQVDEIVVVDTGSTDNTIETACSLGASIYHFSWQDDFAAARNYALSQLRGEWVVFLDADEYFSPQTAENLRQLIAAQGKETNLLLVKRQDVDDAGQEMMSLYVPRIFRIRDDLRYAGAIHEELRQAGEIVTGIHRVSPQDLLLIHTGYAGAQGAAKAQRNLGILLREMEKSEQPEHFYGYLAEAYDGVDDCSNAMKYAYLDIARGRQAETYASRSYRLLLEKLAVHKRDYLERLRVARMAVQDFPELPEFHAELAESLAMDWQYAEAAQEMDKACALGKAYQGMEPSLFTADIGRQWAQRKSLFARLTDTGSKLQINACVIARNEESNISRWLENAGVYADKCVVLDTGSADRTCELALEAGAAVYHYVWQDDFAAARNEALDYVQGDWIAFLDADEYFVIPQQVRGALAECEVLHPEVEALRIAICNIDADDGNREISRFCNIRLFRNKPDLRYEGKVHENLQKRTGEAIKIMEEPRLEVLHTGYSSSVVMAKTRRNLALLQAEIAEKGEQPQHYRYLADCYYTLGDYQQAQLYALQAIESPSKGQGTHGDMYYMVLLCMKAMAEPWEEQLTFAEAARQSFPAVPDFPAVKGLLCCQAGDYRQGMILLEEACQLAQQSDGSESSFWGDMQAMVYGAKAVCEERAGNHVQALQDSAWAMQINPEEELALEAFCVLRQDESLPQQVAALQPYFRDDSRDLLYLCRFCERQGFGSLYKYYREQLRTCCGQELPRQGYYHWLEEGDWPALIERVQGGLTQNLEFMVRLLLQLQGEQGDVYRQVERQLLSLLPAEVQTCWQHIARGETVTAWPVYKILWQYVLRYGEDTQIAAFGAAALPDKEMRQQVIKDVLEQERWQAALGLLAKVDQEEADGSFLRDLGRCLYHLGDYPAAREALDMARQAGIDDYLLKSYEYWLQETEKI